MPLSVSKYDEVTRLVSIMLDMRDPWNHHGERVAELVDKMAESLSINQIERYLMVVGARIHDIGKLAINPVTLNIPRILTNIERTEMELHVEMGWVVARKAGYDTVIQDIVKSHHENWDGSGYPDGLAGYAIPLAARIVHLCDVYASMRSDRAYRQAFSHEFTMAFLGENRGRMFDPSLLELFERIVDESAF